MSVFLLLQNSLNMQRQRLSQVQQQAQMASNSPMHLTQLRQQQEALMQNIAATENQIKLLSQNLNTLRSNAGSAPGGPQQQQQQQPAAVTPQGCRGSGIEASELSSRLAELRFANNQSQHQPQHQQHQQHHQQQHWNRSGGSGHVVSDMDGHSAKLQQVHSASNLQASMGLGMPPNSAFGRGNALHPSSSDPVSLVRFSAMHRMHGTFGDVMQFKRL